MSAARERDKYRERDRKRKRRIDRYTEKKDNDREREKSTSAPRIIATLHLLSSAFCVCAFNIHLFVCVCQLWGCFCVWIGVCTSCVLCVC